MKKAYILTGDPVEVEKVIRENRIRVNRGVINFTPVEPEAATDVPTAPDAAHNESGAKNPEPIDEKTLDVEDLKEVDLDADDKNQAVEDSKDAPAPDVKESECTQKTSKRSKKSE